MVVFEWRLGAPPQVCFANEGVRRWGYDAARFHLGELDFLGMIVDQDRRIFLEELAILNDTSCANSVEHSLMRIVEADGDTVWVRAKSIRLESSRTESETVRYRTYLIDASREHAAEIARRRSEEQFQQIFETNVAVKLLIDPEGGRIVQANQAASKFYGYSVAELTSMKISQINMLSADEVAMEMQRARNEERLFFNFQHRLASGDIRDVEVYSGPVSAKSGSLLYSIVFDVTGRNLAMRSLEENHNKLQVALRELECTQGQLVRRERLAAIGQLTTGIAHDFNNIMTGIVCTAELMSLSDDDLSNRQRHDIAQILASSDRATQLIRQLLDFSRQSNPDTRAIDLVSTTREVIEFLRRMIPERIHLEFEPSATEMIIEAAPDAIQQVITNLVLNARDAISNAGSIAISVDRVVFDQTQLCAIGDSTFCGEWIRLTVQDDGSGIPPDVQPRVFEPFFTSKASGSGSGLGLSQVAGIIAQHFGHVQLKTAEDEGTRISCYFKPLEVDQVPAASPTEAKVVHGNGELILLVEDDAVVRDSCLKLLEFLNYRVVTAEDGVAALEAYHAQARSIALVITDTVMPNMGGVELAQALSCFDPSVKILMMSGYPLGQSNNAELEQHGWLPKPIEVSTLSTGIRQKLEAS